MRAPRPDRSRLRRRAATLRRWIVRYGPAELAGTACASLFAWLATELTDSRVAAAFAFTWGENLSFYGVMLGRELAARGGIASLGPALRDLVLEFGAAEALDSLLLRPACLLAGLALAPHPALGLAVGKAAADLSFYAPAIGMHELLRRWRTATP